jgi:2-methylcitrate dehydratase
MFPAKQPSKVVITTKSGQTYSEYLEYPKGDPREPMSLEDLDNKFNALTSSLLSSARQNEIKEMVFNAEQFSAKEFMNKLSIN